MSPLISRLSSGAAILVVLAALSLGTVLRPAGPTIAAPLAANSRTLVVARYLGDTKSIDPGRCYEFSCVAAITNVYENLISYKGPNVTKPVGVLATSWKITNGNKVYTFQLRHGVKFSTGRTMTAADVVFSYLRLGYLNDNPAFLMQTAPDYGISTVHKVQAIGKYAVRIILTTPDTSFLSSLSDTNFGVMDSKAVKAHGGVDTTDAATKDTAVTWLNEHSVGTGPFIMTSWVRGASGQIVLKRNTHYWGKKPYLNQIIFTGITSSSVERLEVAKGTIDIAQSVDNDGAAALRGNRNVKVLTGNTLDLIYMGMTLNCSISAPLCKPKVRQAVRDALDYNQIIKGLLRGVGTQPNSMIPLGMVGNDPSFNNKVRPKHNLTLAKKLLRQAGYPNGFSDTLNYDGGVTYDGVSYDLLAPAIQNELSKVGIHMKLNPMQDSVLLPAYRGQKLSSVLYNWGVDYPDANDYAGPFSPGGGPAKRMWYVRNPHLASIVARADTITNPKQRTALYHEVQQIWLKESPWVGVVQPKRPVILHKGISNYTYSVVYAGSDFRYVHKK